PLEDPRTQANFVAQRILELRDEGIEMEEIAILYRAHYQSLEIQMELTSRNIPFEITSGLRFFEQSHIKDIAAFLRFVVNRKDEVSFKRFCLLLPGIGNMTAEKMWRSWLKTGHQNEENPPKTARSPNTRKILRITGGMLSERACRDKKRSRRLYSHSILAGGLVEIS
ncbi:hypothetical protein OAF32_01150, partial [Akkermansiaceae bacterium]|nr:hypothetical protein [Akkermansiaceae bacterium]